MKQNADRGKVEDNCIPIALGWGIDWILQPEFRWSLASSPYETLTHLGALVGGVREKGRRLCVCVWAKFNCYNICWIRKWRICLQCRRLRFSPWVGKIPWRRKRQPTPAFLPGESHGQRSLAGYSPWGRKESDMTEQLTVDKFWQCIQSQGKVLLRNYSEGTEIRLREYVQYWYRQPPAFDPTRPCLTSLSLTHTHSEEQGKEEALEEGGCFSWKTVIKSSLL